MPASPDAAATFTLALTSLDGVGHVTARRLLTRFASYDDLRDHSREQVFLRIKGVPNAEAIAERLFDDALMSDALEHASEQAEALAERGVHLLCPRSSAWPGRLDALDAAARPLLLWAYGDPSALQRATTAFLARPPMNEAPFERAQALMGHLLTRGVVPIVGAQNGFDVALAKRAAGQQAAAILVAACGLAKVPRQLRPVASQTVRAGGLMLSPFPMQHGPFDHDDRQRARLQAALANTAVFAPPPADTPEARALAWATEAELPTFVLGDTAPGGARPVSHADDFEAVFEAASGTAPS